MKELHVNTNVPANFSEEKTYLCEYAYGESRWAVEISAHSYEEAEQKLRSLSRGKVLGEVKAVIPIPTTWSTKVAARIKNTMNRLLG